MYLNFHLGGVLKGQLWLWHGWCQVKLLPSCGGGRGGNILTYTCLCILHDRWGHQSTGTEWTVHPYPQIQLVSPCLSVPACCIYCSRKFTCCVLLHLNSLVLVNLFRGWFYIEANTVALAVCSRLGLRQWVILWWLMHRLSNLSEIENLIAGLCGVFSSLVTH